MKRNALTLVMLLALLAAAAFLLFQKITDPALRHADTFSGVREAEDGSLLVYEHGALQPDFTGIVKENRAGRWWYAQNGRVDRSYTGFARNARGWWYVDKGLVDFEKSDIVEGSLDGETALWYLLGGRVRTDYTGLTDYADESRCYMVRDGRVDLSYTGFAQNTGGWWYVDGGRVDLEKQGLVEGSVNGKTALWYVINGRVQLGRSGFVSLEGDDSLWFVFNGCADPTLTGIVPDGDEYRYCINGRAELQFRGAVSFDDIKWIVTDGRARKVETEADRTLYNAFLYLADITDESMSREEKLQVCFDHIIRDCREYNPRLPHLRQVDWPQIYANDIFESGGGNCLSFAAGFAYLAKAIGFEDVYCCNSGGHGWAEVEGLIYDPELTRHSTRVVWYGISYDEFLGADYRNVIKTAVGAGREWMRVEI